MLIKSLLSSRHTALVPLLAAAVLVACASKPEPAPAPTPPPAVAAAPTPAPAPPPATAPAAAPAPVVVATSPGALALNDGVAAFQKGDYRRAEAKLAESQKLGLNYSDEQQRAYKTQAFLYCVTKRTALCEKSFQSAFDINSAFELTRAERGHPVWGPVFAKVQKKQPK
jgi:hypothetical protein